MFDTDTITDTTAVVQGDYVTIPESQYDHMFYQLEAATSAIMQLRKEDAGWGKLDGDDLDTIPHETLVENANQVRAFSQLNPLMKRGKIIRAGYVFGDGINITARSDGKAANTQDVATVIDEFVEDNRNLAAVFSTNAQHSIEHDLFDDGNVFLGHWVNPLTGFVQVRQISFDQITRIRTRPGDDLLPQFYLRQWTLTDDNGNTKQLKAWYPDLRHHPSAKMKKIEGIPVLWPGKTYPGYGTGAAIYHMKVNALGRRKLWGVGDGYAAMPWAKGYTGFMNDWARLMNSLSKLSYNFKGAGGQDQMRRAVAGLQNGPSGGMTYGTMEVEAPNIRGASFDADSGRPFAALVAAALGVSVTILTADPGSTGARAVAETLDTPQRNEMKARQRVHVSYYRAVCDFLVQQAVIAPRGPLRGTVKYEDDQLIVEFRDKTDPNVDITMPDLEDIDTKVMIEAIAQADATGKLPPVETLKLILRAFKYDDLASIVDANTDDEGNWIDPYAATDAAAGRAAADLLRRGGNPADVL